VIDLRTKIEKFVPKDGMNTVDKNLDGVSLLAKVSNGRFIGWEARGPAGEVLPVHQMTSPPTVEKKKKRCYVCYETKDRIVCWIVPCDTGPFRPPVD
jgi:hypothetical protein